jgi:hypothetical protein
MAGASVVDAAIDVSAGESDARPEAGPEAGPVEAGQSEFPIGVYDHCAYSAIDVPGGGGALPNLGSSIVLEQTGSTITVGFGGDGGAPAESLAFTSTSPTSATLSEGQEFDGVLVACGPLDLVPAVAQLASGALTYNGGTVFLSVLGTTEPIDAGTSCMNPGGSTAFIAICGDGAAVDGGATASGTKVPAGDFPGVYTCADSVVEVQPGVEAESGGSGTLTVTGTGDRLTAAFAGDPYVSGSLAFAVTTSNAAAPATSGQTLQVS